MEIRVQRQNVPEEVRAGRGFPANPGSNGEIGLWMNGAWSAKRQELAFAAARTGYPLIPLRSLPSLTASAELLRSAITRGRTWRRWISSEALGEATVCRI